MNVPGLILAAGASSRMGRPKALLALAPGGEPFVARIARTLAGAGVDPVVIVTRAELAGAIRAAAPHAGVVVNPHPERGQLSSLLAGLETLGEEVEGVLVALVDVPSVRRETVARLLEAWRRSRAPLVRPACGGRYGHPVIFGVPLLEALRGADLDEGARPVVRRFTPQAVTVEVDDPAVLLDVDTPSEYERLVDGEEP